jgi:hypothetical protein
MTRVPVIAAWGAGVDSTAMIIEHVSRGEPLDMVLFADTGSEKDETYAYLPLFERWMDEHGIAHETVRYVPRNFKHWPPYDSLHTNMLTNGTLPSKAFGRGACSLKAKVGPQDAWTERWEPAIRCWASGRAVEKLIGFDASPADTRRYVHAEGYLDPRYAYRYPLREWGWGRRECEARIAAEGLPVPVKSSCLCCPAMTPPEVDRLSADQLRTIVLMEARAKPWLRTVEGLWRRRVLGRRGATPKPGAITDYIRERWLLSPDEIDRIVATAPLELLAFQAAQAALPLEERVSMGRWLQDFHRAAERLR